MKKSLSILLALLMILSSLPVMAFTASADEPAAKADTNVMANYTAKDFGKWRWNTITDNTSIAKGDSTSDILVTFPGSQNIFTTAALEPNTKYSFDFEWYFKYVDGTIGRVLDVKVFPVQDGVDVYDINQYKVFDNDTYGTATEADMAEFNKNVWYEGTMPAGEPNAGQRHNGYLAEVYGGEYGTNLVTSKTTTTTDVPNDSWHCFNATFTTTEHTNYIIIINFHGGANSKYEMYLADFSLMDPDYIPFSEKRATNFDTFRWTQINLNAAPITVDGITSEMQVDSCISHRVFTTITSNGYKESELTFKYYIPGGTLDITDICVYPDTVGGDIHCKQDESNPANGWYEGAYNGTTYYAQFVPGRLSAKPAGIQTSRSYGDTSADGTTWQTATVKFPSNDAEKYHVIISFGGSKEGGNTCYFADFQHNGTGKAKPGNILDEARNANGEVTWTVDSGVMSQLDPRNSYEGGLDNPSFSVNGGYAWGFGYAGADLKGDNYARVNIKAKGLKAGKTYDFSYIQADGFRFMIDTIKSGDNAATITVEPTITTLGNPKGNYISGAEKTAAMFTVPVDGDYVITLKSNRDYPSSYNCWKTTYLCDLELYERGAMYNVAAKTEGNGAVLTSQSGLVEEGTAVTFTATAEKYESFLGWYVNGELVSEDATYVATVAGDLAPVAKFTEKSTNYGKDVVASDWLAWTYSEVSETNNSRFGGNAYYVNKSMYQNAAVELEGLEPNTEYQFSFEWMSVANASGLAYPQIVAVYPASSGTIVPGRNTTTPTPYKPSGYENLAKAVTYPSDTNNNAALTSWNTLSGSFTTTDEGDYYLTIYFGRNGTANADQAVIISDLMVKAKPVITYTGTQYEWAGVHWSSVASSEDTKDGGYAYHVASAMNQNINTEVTLKPGTTYKYSFNWKAVDNAKGLAYAASSSIYSANSGDRSKGNKTNYEWNDAGTDYTPIYIPNEGYSNLMENVSNPNGTRDAADDVLTAWNTYSANFTTIEDAEYYLFINFGLKGSNGDQAVIISDVVIEEVVEGAAPAGDDMIAHPGVSIRKASESSFGQALRYKFTVDADVIANAQADGYELVEYGTAVAIVEELNGHAADPILGATAYTVKKGVAYDKANGVNVQYDVAENGDVTYTAALYNIPTNKYDAEIAVRPYAIFQNADGETYVRYGTTRNASVFATVEAILNGTNTDDKDYVNNTLLAGDIMDAYNEWLAK